MLKTIAVQKFRNHESFSCSLQKQTLVVGSNAVGKTNLLESIYVGLTGSGFRGNDKDLINFESSWGRVDLQADRQKTVKLEVNSTGKIIKTLEVDSVKRTPRDFCKNDAVVLFEPNELRMLTGPPELRRAWMDNLISKIEPKYSDSLARYKRALAQRNSLLKRNANDDQFFVWELKMGEYGEQLVNQRMALASKANKSLPRLYSGISNKDDLVEIVYRIPSETYASWLVGKLALSRERDKLIGFTPNGPHRDDFDIFRNGASINSTGSRGELRSMVLSMKFYELELIEKARSIKPVLLLDDVFSELDENRRVALLNVTANYQSIFTSTDKPAAFVNDVDIIKLT